MFVRLLQIKLCYCPCQDILYRVSWDCTSHNSVTRADPVSAATRSCPVWPDITHVQWKTPCHPCEVTRICLKTSHGAQISRINKWLHSGVLRYTRICHIHYNGRIITISGKDLCILNSSQQQYHLNGLVECAVLKTSYNIFVTVWKIKNGNNGL